MAKISVLTLTRNRGEFLINLLEGLSRSSRLPDECIVVHMNEPAEPLGSWNFPCEHYSYSSEIALPLPHARNRAAELTQGDILIFLDVDCIPAHDMVAAYEHACEQAPDAVLMSQVNYLNKEATIDWSIENTEECLRSQSKPHPKRDIDPIAPLIAESNYGLFWSLSFALTRTMFEQLGGFSDCYPSYGAEDTDFAWKARAAGVPLLWAPDSVVYHQWHTSSVPPTHNFESIIYNARVFYKRWAEWPMGSWLSVFVEKGYIDWTPTGDTLKVLQRPPQARPLMLNA